MSLVGRILIRLWIRPWSFWNQRTNRIPLTSFAGQSACYLASEPCLAQGAMPLPEMHSAWNDSWGNKNASPEKVPAGVLYCQVPSLAWHVVTILWLLYDCVHCGNAIVIVIPVGAFTCVHHFKSLLGHQLILAESYFGDWLKTPASLARSFRITPTTSPRLHMFLFILLVPRHMIFQCRLIKLHKPQTCHNMLSEKNSPAGGLSAAQTSLDRCQSRFFDTSDWHGALSALEPC